METSASVLRPGDRIFDVQIDGERIKHRTTATITGVWHHGPLVTVLTSRGYVEYSDIERVQTL